MPVDPSQLAQDKDFLSAAPADQVKYLSAQDSDFAKATPEDQMGYVAHVTGKASLPTPTVDSSMQAKPVKPAPQPGFGTRLAQSVGLPTSLDQLKAMGQGPSATDAMLGPGGAMLRHYIGNAVSGAKQGYQENRDAAHNIEAGQPLLPNLGKSALGTLQASVNAIPFVGPSINTAGEDVAQKNYAGAAGGLTGVVGQVALPKILEGATSLFQKPNANIVRDLYSKPGDHIAASLRSNAKVDVPAEATNAHSAIEEGLADRGFTTKDFNGRNGPKVLQAGLDNAMRLQELRAKQIIDPIRGDAVDPQALAENSPELAARFAGRNKITYGDVDAARIEMNKELRRANFYSKDPTMQNAIGDPLASTEAAVKQARDLVYDKAQQTTGVDIRPLKQTESSLLKLMDLANTTANTLSAKGAVHAATPFSAKAAQSVKSILAVKANPISAFFSYEKPGLTSPLEGFNSNMQKAFPKLSSKVADTNVTFPKYNLTLKSPGDMPEPIQRLLHLSGGENIPGEELKLTHPPGETPAALNTQEPLEFPGGETIPARSIPDILGQGLIGDDLNLTPPGDMPADLQRVLPFTKPGLPSKAYPGAKR